MSVRNIECAIVSAIHDINYDDTWQHEGRAQRVTFCRWNLDLYVSKRLCVNRSDACLGHMEHNDIDCRFN